MDTILMIIWVSWALYIFISIIKQFFKKENNEYEGETMVRTVGIETAKALSQADVKAFIGDSGKEGFDLGKIITGLQVANDVTAQAVINKIARPNDLGLSQLNIEDKSTSKKR